MIRKTISMPDSMGAWINERIHNGQYNNESEYFRDLVRRDQESQDEVIRIRTLLGAAEQSGISSKSVLDIMSDVEERGLHDAQISTDE
jgi:antitoxin ParD1/3/4